MWEVEVGVTLGAFDDKHDATQCTNAYCACTFPPHPLSCSNFDRVNFLDKYSLGVLNYKSRPPELHQNSTLGQVIMFLLSQWCGEHTV